MITITDQLTSEILARHSRAQDTHKGAQGHALQIAGSYGKMGAAVLTALGCFRAGIGKLTCLVPKCGMDIMQTAVPEALVEVDQDEKMITQAPENLNTFDVISIGPGLGVSRNSIGMFSEVVQNTHNPLVIDADGLNILSKSSNSFDQLKEDTILTPHPKEFSRMFGGDYHDRESLQKIQLQKSLEYKIIIALKGDQTSVSLPSGEMYINPAGSPALATAGTGDVLTGIITAFVGQGFKLHEAAVAGVHLHALAGQIAEKELTTRAVIARDIPDSLPRAFQRLV